LTRVSKREPDFKRKKKGMYEDGQHHHVAKKVRAKVGASNVCVLRRKGRSGKARGGRKKENKRREEIFGSRPTNLKLERGQHWEKSQRPGFEKNHLFPLEVLKGFEGKKSQREVAGGGSGEIRRHVHMV